MPAKKLEPQPSTPEFSFFYKKNMSIVPIINASLQEYIQRCIHKKPLQCKKLSTHVRGKLRNLSPSPLSFSFFYIHVHQYQFSQLGVTSVTGSSMIIR